MGVFRHSYSNPNKLGLGSIHLDLICIKQGAVFVTLENKEKAGKGISVDS